MARWIVKAIGHQSVVFGIETGDDGEVIGIGERRIAGKHAIGRPCPLLAQRQNLLEAGSLAGVFVTILNKAMMYAMLDRHPIDSGLLDEEYDDVYGIDLTDFQDLEASLTDGRFESLYCAVLVRAKQLTGLS